MRADPGAVDVTSYFVLTLSADGEPATGLVNTESESDSVSASASGSSLGLELTYIRDRAAPVTDWAIELNGAEAAHEDYGVYEPTEAYAPGFYRIDWPDAAFAAGSDKVQLIVNYSTTRLAVIECDLAFDLQSVDGGATQVARKGADADTLTSLSGQLDVVTTDTNELQTDWTNGGRLDVILDAVLADTGELQTDWTNGGRLDVIIDAVLADTGELQTDWTDGGRLDLILDAIVADTNELQTDWTDAGRLDVILDAIVADTNELQTDWADGGRLDLLLDAAAAGAGLTAQQTRDAMKLAATAGAPAAGSVDIHLDDILADTGELQTDWVDGGRLDLIIDAILADTNELQTDWTNGGRLDLILDSLVPGAAVNVEHHTQPITHTSS